MVVRDVDAYLATRPQTPFRLQFEPSPYFCNHHNHAGPELIELQEWKATARVYENPLKKGLCHYCTLKKAKGDISIIHWTYNVMIANLRSGVDSLHEEGMKHRMDNHDRGMPSFLPRKSGLLSDEIEQEVADLKRQYYDELTAYMGEWQGIWGANDYGLLQDYRDKTERLGEEFVEKPITILQRPGA